MKNVFKIREELMGFKVKIGSCMNNVPEFREANDSWTKERPTWKYLKLTLIDIRFGESLRGRENELQFRKFI